eukprot:PITA_10608
MANFSTPCEKLVRREYDKSFNEFGNEEVIIVGAGPSGLAVAACLANLGISSVVLERERCLASLWKHRTYDRLQLHIGKKFCQLPLMPFPEEYPMFVTKDQFIFYLEEYAKRFNIHPLFCQFVESASFCQETGKWHVRARGSLDNSEREYLGRFLVVATGENSENFMPDISGLEDFAGIAMHSIDYKNGKDFEGKKVLVVGCGNSGMEIALDLANNNARPTLVVRSPSHVLPREFFGRSIFSVAMLLLKLLPLRMVDNLLVMYSNLTLGNTASFGIPRPVEGPFELKFRTGKTPVLDNGTMAYIRQGKIKVVPNFNRATATGVEFEGNFKEDFDAIILATGYRSEVGRWLKNGGELFSDDGFPRNRSPDNWKGSDGLYAAGLGRAGLMGSSADALLIAQDIFQAVSTSS